MAKVVCAHLTDGADTGNVSSYTTASVTPEANRLLLLAVVSSRASLPEVPTVTGLSLTWVQVATVTFASVAAPIRRLTVFRALGASPTAGTISIDFGGVSQTGCAWSLDLFGDVNRSGSDGSGAIQNSATNSADAGTSLTVSGSGPLNADAATYGAFARTDSSAGFSPGSGFTDLADVAYATPSVNLMTEWKIGQDNSVGATFASADVGGIAIWIADNPSHTPVTIGGTAGATAGGSNSSAALLAQVSGSAGGTAGGSGTALLLAQVAGSAGGTGGGSAPALLLAQVAGSAGATADGSAPALLLAQVAGQAGGDAGGAGDAHVLAQVAGDAGGAGDGSGDAHLLAQVAGQAGGDADGSADAHLLAQIAGQAGGIAGGQADAIVVPAGGGGSDLGIGFGVLAGLDQAGGTIRAGAGPTFVTMNGLPWATLGAPVDDHGSGAHGAATMAQGSAFVTINGLPVVIGGNAASCGHLATAAGFCFTGA